MKDSIKKIAVGALFVVSLGSYALYLRNATPATADTTAASVTSAPAQTASETASAAASASTASSGTTQVASSGTGSNTTSSGTATTGTYKDGTYTGSEEDAYYGFLKVAITVSGGKLTAIKFLEYPSDESESRRINEQAIPILTQEALASQSADGISGTTRSSQTTAAFIDSLSTALEQAKA